MKNQLDYPKKKKLGIMNYIISDKNIEVTEGLQNAAYLRDAFIDEDIDDDDDIQIVRSKKFSVKPMYPEDACIQMDLLGHNFFVFRNAETDEVNVVYKRKGDTYGLIEPEF